ncbi:alpha/beta fold hydrolase [Radiobacillus sp. PE A8.2]|uniref:alpha/beta fold hydrolase n=1 Tax=Radiobacillus sp. PE A8.2 TaxID=3380349 RepID=UPI00388EEB9C
MFIKTGEHVIHALSFGKGDIPFVAHGGWIGSWELWEQQIERLSQERRCVAFDHLGSGESPVPAGTTITLELLVDNLKQVLDQMNVDECILAAESSGVKVVLLFALLYPERVKGLVLVDGFASTFSKEDMKGSIEFLNMDYHGYLETFVDFCLPSGEPHFKRWGLNILKRARVEDAIALLKLNTTADLLSRISEITAPTLIIHGEKDSIIPMAAAHQLLSSIPNASLVVIPEAGHVPTITHSEQVTNAIMDFLKTELVNENDFDQ